MASKGIRWMAATLWESRESRVPLAGGEIVTYLDWCLLQRARLLASGYSARVVASRERCCVQRPRGDLIGIVTDVTQDDYFTAEVIE